MLSPLWSFSRRKHTTKCRTRGSSSAGSTFQRDMFPPLASVVPSPRRILQQHPRATRDGGSRTRTESATARRTRPAAPSRRDGTPQVSGWDVPR
ncbi:hypothetical protein GCM10010266_50370 [Streptomyces griseomycini]|nr:hypothetical protein GCM10010266_50370 [Streptomyces griseomycini]GGR55863.1 hypothetical protein GCM10015536_71340 [Streptomyces griseomycini]